MYFIDVNLNDSKYSFICVETCFFLASRQCTGTKKLGHIRKYKPELKLRQEKMGWIRALK